ncbi:MAG: DUF6062 family protein [Lachnospiraceae bacterium]|jgi:hypothetical protein|nr:DUF6062 family protein [Lachnospiraceae bacterium]
MKEQLYMIPLNDAVNAGDECPFCFIERNIVQDSMDFVLGNASSYMESDVRQMTDQEGFCRPHFKQMFDYGNTLGNAWILKTHYRKMIGEFKHKTASFQSGKSSFLQMRKKGTSGNTIATWIEEKEASCYICKRFKETYQRYMDTFFYMLQRDSVFQEKIAKSKGFCLPHFRDLCLAADVTLSDRERSDFYQIVNPLMIQNMERVAEDVAWMVEKFDYLNKDADWKNSRDAIQRGMQKLKGGYPADPPYKKS